MKTLSKIGLAALVATAVACGGSSGGTTFLSGAVTQSSPPGGTYTGLTTGIHEMTAVPVVGLLYDMNAFGQTLKVQFPTGSSGSGKLYQGMAFQAQNTGCVVTYSESIPPKSWVSSSGVVRVSSSDGISLDGVGATLGMELVTLDGTVTGFSNSVPSVVSKGTLELPGSQTYDQSAVLGTTFTFTNSSNPAVNVVKISLTSSGELPTTVGQVHRVTAGAATVSLQAVSPGPTISSTNGYMSIEKTSTGYNFSVVGFTTTTSGVGPFNGLLIH